MPVDPQIAGVLAFLEATGNPPMEETTPGEARLAFRALVVDLVRPEDVVPVGSSEDMVIADRPARVYRPVSGGPHPTLVYFHGGGFVIGDLDTHDQTSRRICRGADAVVVSVDYRLAPEHPFPAALDDALAAADWAFDHLDELGGNDRLAVGGDSAGGTLAAVVSQLRKGMIHAQLLIYPATDWVRDYPSRTENGQGYFLTIPLMEWFGRLYLTGADGVSPDDLRVSPAYGDLTGTPRAVVVTAEFDPLRDEGEAYAAALAAAGTHVDRVRYDSMIHGFADLGAFSALALSDTDDLIARFRLAVH